MADYTAWDKADPCEVAPVKADNIYEALEAARGEFPEASYICLDDGEEEYILPARAQGWRP